MIHHLTALSLCSAVALVAAPPPLAVQVDVDSSQHTFDSGFKVPVELGVMSRCPDATLCENLFDRVLQKVSDKMDLTLRYVAKCVEWHSNKRCSYLISI